MADFGHELWFGAFLTPDAAGHHRIVRQAVLADDIGLDIVGIQDHPYQPAFLDTWTLLSTLAGRTERVRLFPDVVNLPLRPPAVLARAAASLDILSGGRVELGLGSGAFWDGIAAMGGPRRSPGEAVDALEEAITVLRALWTPGDEGVRLDGGHYRLEGARPGPFPPHPIGLWLGAYKRRMLELTGRLGDGWVPSAGYAAPGELGAMSEIVDAAAERAGRDPGEIRRVYNIAGRFSGAAGGGFLDGPPTVWAEQLAELALGHGMSVFVLAVDDDRDLKVFAEEVAPAVREAVARERARKRRPDAEGPIGIAEAPQTEAPQAEAPQANRAQAGAVLDEATRPRLPKRDISALPPRRQANGQRLVLIHDHLRRELTQIRDALEQVAAGRSDAAALRSMINELTMRQNYWTLGTFCASYCRLLTTHHTIEDEHMFPMLAAAQKSLAPVVARLEEEHEVIAGVLTQLDAALVAMIEDPDRLDGVRDQVELLSDVLLSHLRYEEEELVEPIARLNLDI
ncbi:LLM class flavin-dependent oxidoreductase [Microbispora sp. SCL1-1]|uniref:LLM class flavin-dependent oxidoreductase n=1 Tax=unclassified Microbispora TaxID=2614687 RepID=UPI00115BACA6|nr:MULTISPECIES: LLM class flavin-dependent oxidoreductase [unclassified Microbispora]NJP28029.1 LLM class flavin-dependent oxidoreductase [Microbispora sp. CL1-1]TQS10374.1 LLM class flavin-dependent oxidoreductase [Microbispora sp. SCL1-1]